MNKIITIFAVLITSLTIFAQDVIITTDSKKIDAKIMEVSQSEIKYKELDNLDGPIFIIATSDISSITYSNGKVILYNATQTPRPFQTDELSSIDTQTALLQVNSHQEQIVENEQDTIYTAADCKGNVLPKFVYTKVNVPGKKHKKNRYVGGNMVLTEKEFGNFLQMYCPEAYKHYSLANAMLICECVSILIGLIPVVIFMAICISHSSKVLPIYNSQCSGNPSAMLELDREFQDSVQFASIDFTSQI